MLTGAWWSVTSTTLQNCWKKAGLMSTDGEQQSDEPAAEGSCSEFWSEVTEQLDVDPSATFDDYVECDSVQGTEAQYEDCSDDTGDDVTVAPEDRDESVSATDALDYLRKLRIFIECSLAATLTDTYCKLPMAITAENLAEKYKISRQEVDQFALRSQKRWAEANKAGRFKEEIVPVPLKVKGKEVLFDTDEHPRPDSTIESLGKLPALFKKDGTVTAGNASGICDGAGAIVIASEDAVKKHNLKPLARIVGYSYVGVDPTIMGIGPVPAIRQLCEKTGVKLQDLDLIDVNEAFASQFLAVEKELGSDPEKTNVNGGAVALGHPVGASGARILANITYELRYVPVGQ
ncbi:hypothetical protein HPB50_021634 [Hyalomma asiaticum]|uniref:Uncharacterized protein n=1 Tax=Hyalomma asiaticum TaxID=266040 RepID=A0ACB7T2B5_HYAAI|nr:hypothetical protein HPB50_021634 [Hyalomma asiaticum]